MINVYNIFCIPIKYLLKFIMYRLTVLSKDISKYLINTKHKILSLNESEGDLLKQRVKFILSLPSDKVQLEMNANQCVLKYDVVSMGKFLLSTLYFAPTPESVLVKEALQWSIDNISEFPFFKLLLVLQNLQLVNDEKTYKDIIINKIAPNIQKQLLLSDPPDKKSLYLLIQRIGKITWSIKEKYKISSFITLIFYAGLKNIAKTDSLTIKDWRYYINFLYDFQCFKKESNSDNTLNEKQTLRQLNNLEDNDIEMTLSNKIDDNHSEDNIMLLKQSEIDELITEIQSGVEDEFKKLNSNYSVDIFELTQLFSVLTKISLSDTFPWIILIKNIYERMEYATSSDIATTVYCIYKVAPLINLENSQINYVEMIIFNLYYQLHQVSDSKTINIQNISSMIAGNRYKIKHTSQKLKFNLLECSLLLSSLPRFKLDNRHIMKDIVLLICNIIENLPISNQISPLLASMNGITLLFSTDAISIKDNATLNYFYRFLIHMSYKLQSIALSFHASLIIMPLYNLSQFCQTLLERNFVENFINDKKFTEFVMTSSIVTFSFVGNSSEYIQPTHITSIIYFAGTMFTCLSAVKKHFNSKYHRYLKCCHQMAALLGSITEKISTLKPSQLYDLLVKLNSNNMHTVASDCYSFSFDEIIIKILENIIQKFNFSYTEIAILGDIACLPTENSSIIKLNNQLIDLINNQLVLMKQMDSNEQSISKVLSLLYIIIQKDELHPQHEIWISIAAVFNEISFKYFVQLLFIFSKCEEKLLVPKLMFERLLALFSSLINDQPHTGFSENVMLLDNMSKLSSSFPKLVANGLNDWSPFILKMSQSLIKFIKENNGSTDPELVTKVLYCSLPIRSCYSDTVYLMNFLYKNDLLLSSINRLFSALFSSDTEHFYLFSNHQLFISKLFHTSIVTMESDFEELAKYLKFTVKFTLIVYSEQNISNRMIKAIKHSINLIINKLNGLEKGIKWNVFTFFQLFIALIPLEEIERYLKQLNYSSRQSNPLKMHVLLFKNEITMIIKIALESFNSVKTNLSSNSDLFQYERFKSFISSLSILAKYPILSNSITVSLLNWTVDLLKSINSLNILSNKLVVSQQFLLWLDVATVYRQYYQLGGEKSLCLISESLVKLIIPEINKFSELKLLSAMLSSNINNLNYNHDVIPLTNSRCDQSFSTIEEMLITLHSASAHCIDLMPMNKFYHQTPNSLINYSIDSYLSSLLQCSMVFITNIKEENTENNNLNSNTLYLNISNNVKDIICRFQVNLLTKLPENIFKPDGLKKLLDNLKKWSLFVLTQQRLNDFNVSICTIASALNFIIHYYKNNSKFDILIDLQQYKYCFKYIRHAVSPDGNEPIGKPRARELIELLHSIYAHIHFFNSILSTDSSIPIFDLDIFNILLDYLSSEEITRTVDCILLCINNSDSHLISQLCGNLIKYNIKSDAISYFSF